MAKKALCSLAGSSVIIREVGFSMCMGDVCVYVCIGGERMCELRYLVHRHIIGTVSPMKC